jgi:hypothetical protein
MKAKIFVLLSILIVASTVDAQEYLFGDGVSDAFMQKTNAGDVYDLLCKAQVRFALNQCTVVNGERQTYMDKNVLVIEANLPGQTVYRFGLKFAGESAAFNFFLDVKSQLSRFVPVFADGETWGAYFEDGLVAATLSGVDVIFAIGQDKK